MNLDITLECVRTGVKKKDIARELGITDTSFSRKLRKELTPGDKEKVMTIIKKLSK